MQQFNKTLKLKSNQKKRPVDHKGKRRPFKKNRTSRPVSSLDRFYSERRVLASRLLQITNAKNKNSYFAKRTLHHTGALGRAILRQKTSLLRAPLLSASYLLRDYRASRRNVACRHLKYTVGQKYRLKTTFRNSSAGIYPLGAAASIAMLRRKAVLYLTPGFRLSSVRTRSLVRAKVALLRRAVILQRLAARRLRLKFSSHQSRRKHRRQHRQKSFIKVLQKRSAMHRQFRLRMHAPDGTPQSREVHKQLARIKGLNFRRVRSQRRGVQIRRFRRWWWRQLLQRRRRRSRRLFANIFGRKRWRLQRRDRHSLKLSSHRYHVKASLLRATAGAHTELQSARIFSKRARLISARKQLVKSSTGAIFSSTGFLRSAFRRLLKNKRTEITVASRVAQHASVRLVTRGRFDSHTRLAAQYHPQSMRVSDGRSLLPLVTTIKSTLSAVRCSLAQTKNNHRQKRALLLPLNHARTAKYRNWRAARSVSKLLLQRQLRRGSLLLRSTSSNAATPARVSAQRILHASGASASLGSSRLYTARLPQASGLAAATACTAVPVALLNLIPPSSLPRLHHQKRRPNVSSFGFLGPFVTTAANQNLPYDNIRAIAQLKQQQHRYRELCFYHRRPQLRLPETKMTRSRRRKSGINTFVRNSLKRPRTLLGQQRLLLPPVNAHHVGVKTYRVGYSPRAFALAAYEHRDEVLPIFWHRPHTRANIKAISRIRRQRYTSYKSHYKFARAKAYYYASKKTPVKRVLKFTTNSVKTPVNQYASAAALTRSKILSGIKSNNAFRAPILRIIPRIRLKRARKVFLPRSVVSLPKRTLQDFRPQLSRISAVTTLTAPRQETLAKKVRGLWQARSVRAMLSAERSMSAWSPQISARTRRKHYPRVDGVPLPHRWLGYKAKRERRLRNAQRLRRGIPQIRYTDYMSVKLQYFYGSVGSAGYVRFRRVHRTQSDHSRWWRPLTRAVPFAHPYSRRSLNATRYRKVAFSKALAPKVGDFTRLTHLLRGQSMHSKYPPRTIPWRNFRFPRPRRGTTPKLLQRWTFTSRVGKTSRTIPNKTPVVLSRPPRELHALHKFVSARGAWGNKRWGILDTATLSASCSTQFQIAVSSIPTGVWTALRLKAGSAASYVALRSRILHQLRLWIAKRQKTTPLASKQALRSVSLVLIALIRSSLSTQSSSALVVSAHRQHRGMRANALAARIENKALQFLKLQELPRANAESSLVEMLRREQSKVYKCWLSGVEGVLKRTQHGYTPTSRSRYTDNTATTFGRRRARFPASGRRRKSYDSLLHAFAKKIGPARFRRASKLRFRWADPQLDTSFQENLNVLTPMFGANRRRQTSRLLSSAVYLSAPLRALLVHRAATCTGALSTAWSGNTVKRRFLPLPVRAVFLEKQKELRKRSLPYKHPMYVVRAGILRRALRRRRKERIYIDLRQSARQRRLPRERSRGPWKLRRKLRRSRAAKRGPYSRFTVRKRSKTYSRWTLRHLSAVGPRRGRTHRAALPPVLCYGEEVHIKKDILQKNRKAVRGFTLPSRQRRRKLRRRARDTVKRKRRPRRAKRASRRAAVRNTKHWSEKRDQRVRGVLYSYRRVIVAKKIAHKLRSKFTSRVGQQIANRAHNSRLPVFAVYTAAAAVVKSTNIVAPRPSATAIDAASCFHDRESVWRLRKQSRFTRFRTRSSKLQGVTLRKRRLKYILADFREATASSIPSQLLSASTVFPVISPLWFEPPVTRIVKSAAVKEQEALAAIAAKEESFRLPTQYVESVTALIPELMNFMLSRRIENQYVTYETTQQIIKNIYWSLRVYLNVDPFDNRFFLRDKVPAARVRIFEDLSDLSETQKTLQYHRAALRYRFQPARLVRVRNKLRFREDWLRAFFPAKHALFQESSEDYGNFLITTHRIRRLHIGARGMKSWITAHQLIGQETRARQLLKLRLSRRRSRFETILQTTRRIPTVECAPFTPSVSARVSFFARNFSTYSNRGLALTARWIHRQKRFVSLEQGWRTVAPAAQMFARNRVLARLESRGKTSYINPRWKGITSSLIDARFTRAKSPRSRQYLIRTHKKSVQLPKSKKITGLIFYRALIEKRTLAQKRSTMQWTRARRSSWSSAFKNFALLAKQETWRQEYSLRRVQDALFARTSPHLKAPAAKTSRSILHYRTPRVRTLSTTYKKAISLLQNSVLPAHRFVRLRNTAEGFSRRRRLAISLYRRTTLFPRWTALPKKLNVYRAHGRKSGVVQRVISQQRRSVGYFAVSAGRQIVRSLDLSRACALHTKFNRQTPFETYRPKLWNKLTLRWMKKYRTGRYWLRDTSHWLRDPWLSQIVAADMTLRRDRFGGEIRSRPQQVGEYVAEVDALGRDIRRKDAPKERHKFQKVMPEGKDREIQKTSRILKRGSRSSKLIAMHRLQIADQARRKPIPTLRLANYEYRDVIREHKAEKAKSEKQKEEEEQARIKVYWARKAKKLPAVRPRRLPLKHPANLWLPHSIWKDIQRRIRKFEWRESDQVFVRRGFRNAFRFKPAERRKAPWLEFLMYTRATYSTRLKEFRRRQFPHEQKKFKWLQRVRKTLYPGRRSKYIKWRRWPQLRRYNQKLHYSLFDLRDRRAARRHFRKLIGKSRPAISAFVTMSRGLTDRLDVTCLKMRFAPTIYWARIVAEFGLLRVNGVTVYDPSYRLKPADVIYPNWDTVARFQHYFKPYLRKRQERRRQNKTSTAFYPTNMEYHRGTRAIVYKHAPDESDLRKSSRVRPAYFRWFKLDSV